MSVLAENLAAVRHDIEQLERAAVTDDHLRLTKHAHLKSLRAKEEHLVDLLTRQEGGTELAQNLVGLTVDRVETPGGHLELHLSGGSKLLVAAAYGEELELTYNASREGK